MKSVVFGMMALGLFAGFGAYAADQCIPPNEVVCLIQMDSYGNYNLRTTLQAINSISVVNEHDEIVPDRAKAALSKLDAQAETLKAAGACNVIINDIE